MASWRSLVELEAQNASGYDRTRHTCPVCPQKAYVIDYKRSLSIDHQTGWYRCYRCDFRGRLPGFHDGFHEEQEDPTDEWVPEYVFREPSSFCPVADNPHPILQDARQYLKSRGVSRRAAREAQVGYAWQGRDAGRVVVPFLDHDGCWMGWQGRKIGHKSFHTDKDRKALVFNQPAVAVETATPLMVVEGVYDALPYWPNAVACLGKPYGPQIDLLMRSTRPVVFVLDADAHKLASSLSDRLERCGKISGVVRLPPGQDPSSADHREVWEAVQTAAL